MTTAPKLEPCQEKALQEQRDLATEWMEATGHLPHHCEYELHGIVEDAFTAGLRAAPSAGLREALTQAAVDVLTERTRHKSVEGWTPEHDDEHRNGEMALAAGAYCESAARPSLLARKPGAAYAIPKLWPRGWDYRTWWKPKDPRRDLVRAGALILAEIERLDRAALTLSKEGGSALTPHQTNARDE